MLFFHQLKLSINFSMICFCSECFLATNQKCAVAHASRSIALPTLLLLLWIGQASFEKRKEKKKIESEMRSTA